jgi:hypothetical protein
LTVLSLSNSLAAETEKDSALWAGGLFLTERDKGRDHSAEYQLRLNDHMSSFSSHFLEFLGYRKTTRSLLLYGGYRYTRRSDHNENRLVFGGFWDLTRTGKPVWKNPNGGLSWKMTDRSRLRAQYIWEKFLFRTPKKQTNIIWLRYEMALGKQTRDYD